MLQVATTDCKFFISFYNLEITSNYHKIINFILNILLDGTPEKNKEAQLSSKNWWSRSLEETHQWGSQGTWNMEDTMY